MHVFNEWQKRVIYHMIPLPSRRPLEEEFCNAPVNTRGDKNISRLARQASKQVDRHASRQILELRASRQAGKQTGR